MDVLYFFASIRNPVLTAIFKFFSLFGEEILIFGIICALFWCGNKNLAYRLGLGFFISGLLVQGLKITFRIERPWVIDKSFVPVEGSLTTATGYSFPSGHTQGATALFGALSLESISRKKYIYSLICILMFFFVGISRMYLGVHTPADVFTSMAITFIAALLVHIFMKDQSDTSKDLLISIILATVSIAIMVYSIVLINKGIIPEAEGIDCCKSSGAGLAFAFGRYIERRWIKLDTKTPKLWMQPVKFTVGVAIVLILKEGLKILIGESVVAQVIRYFVLVIWILVIYPIIIKAVIDKRFANNVK